MLVLIPIAILGGACAYLGLRFVRPLRVHWGWRAFGWAWIVLSAALPLVTLVAGRRGIPLGPLPFVGFLLMGITSCVLVFSLLAELVRVPLRLATARRVDVGRRRFFGNVVNASMVGAAGSIGGVGVAQARTLAEVVTVDVPIAGLPAALEGFRIVQLTDVHVGPTIHRRDLEAAIERTHALDPDIVVITGDLIDGYVEDLQGEVEPLATLRARHGVFFVTGNHEYYWNGPAWCEHLRQLGLVVLNNEHRVLEVGGRTILLAGVTDVHAQDYEPTHRSDPEAARAGAPACDVDILLAHQPSSIFAAAEAGYDLQISGHTHGGQYFPMSVLVYAMQPYVAGLHRHADSTWIYVSRGTGYWGPPMRFGAPHEITLLRLQRAA